MSEMNHPTLEKKKIIVAILLSIVVGAVILVGAVLPAEYGMDPTGVGKLLGFNRLYIPSEPSIELATPVNNPLIKLEKAGSAPNVVRPKEADNPAPKIQLEQREDTIKVIIPAGKGLEFKINMLKYGKVKYEWSTDQGVLYFDFHGEVKQVEKAKDVYFESYTIAYSNNMVGTFLAPFEGKHGWYFKNNGKEDIIVNLRLKGQYIL